MQTIGKTGGEAIYSLPSNQFFCKPKFPLKINYINWSICIVSVKINAWKKIFFQVPYTLINIHLIFLLIYDVGTVVIPFFRWGNQGPEKSSQDRTPICLTSCHPSSPRPAPSTFHGRLPFMRWVPALHPRKACRLHVLALSLGIQVD